MDVSTNILLTYLSVRARNITTLDLSNNTELTILAIEGIHDSSLLVLDLSKNTKLTDLTTAPNLKYANISGNTATSLNVRVGNSFATSFSITSGPLNTGAQAGNLTNPNIASFILFPYTAGGKTYVTANIDLGDKTYDLTQEFTLDGTPPQYILAQIDTTQITATNKYFAGWQTSAGVPITEIGSTSGFDNVNHVMWAGFTNINNTGIWDITYHNGSSITYDTYAEGIGLTLPVLTKPGYTFDGWYEDEHFSGSPTTEIDDQATGDKEFWAKWTLIQPTPSIIYNNLKGTNPNPTTYTPGTELPLDPLPDTDTHKFLGWYDNPDFTGEAKTSIPADATGDIELWAHWELIEITSPTDYTIIIICGAALLLLLFLLILFITKKRQKRP